MQILKVDSLGIAKQIGIPLRFIGVGEKVADLEVFIPDRIVSRLWARVIWLL